MADFERPPSHPDEPDRHEVPAQGDRSFPVSAPPPTPLASTTANPIPQQPATIYVPVGPWGRIGSRIMDAFAVLFVFVCPLLLLGLLAFSAVGSGEITTSLEAVSREGSISKVFGWGASVLFVLVAIGSWFFLQIYLVSWKGGNLGKLITGQQIIDATTGNFLSIGQATKRFVIYDFFTIVAFIVGDHFSKSVHDTIQNMGIVWLVILLITIIIDKPDRRGLHDKLCNSRVVKKNLVGNAQPVHPQAMATGTSPAA